MVNRLLRQVLWCKSTHGTELPVTLVGNERSVNPPQECLWRVDKDIDRKITLILGIYDMQHELSALVLLTEAECIISSMMFLSLASPWYVERVFVETKEGLVPDKANSKGEAGEPVRTILQRTRPLRNFYKFRALNNLELGYHVPSAVNINGPLHMGNNLIDRCVCKVSEEVSVQLRAKIGEAFPPELIVDCGKVKQVTMVNTALRDLLPEMEPLAQHLGRECVLQLLPRNFAKFQRNQITQNYCSTYIRLKIRRSFLCEFEVPNPAKAKDGGRDVMWTKEDHVQDFMALFRSRQQGKCHDL
ncbi:hypothetical protein J6590_072106 [Homalodisca vitripennis]|nr:hypothetical protein J6590_072106 [Homalodisca vitripennis]